MQTAVSTKSAESTMVSTNTTGTISAKTYSGCYGGETSNVGDALIVKIQCGNYSPSLSKKQIIFVVDESGSMCQTISSVKASLFAARNALLRMINIDESKEERIDDAERDNLFTEKCNCSIITFSDVATCKWESNAARISRNLDPSSISFSTAVNNIQSDASTNMGDALLMAFNMKLPGYATWIILLTDGCSNKGPCQTASSFRQLITRIPSEAKIIPLGYTTEFDPEVLSILGTMTYLDTKESIAETLGSIMGEIATSYGIGAQIHLPSPKENLVNPDDMIVVPDNIGVSRDIIGSKTIGCLFNERQFMYGYLPWGNTQNSSLAQYHGLQGHISYYDIAWGTSVTIPFIIEHGGPSVPDDVCEAYFESSKARIILGIYQNKRNKPRYHKYIESIKAKLEDWKHPLAIPHKEEIFRILETKFDTKEDYCTAMGIATSAQNQTNYTNMGRYATNPQRTASSTASEDYRLYQPYLVSTDLNRQSTRQTARSTFVPVTIDASLMNQLSSNVS